MNTRFFKSLGLAVCTVVLGLCLGCGAPGASGSADQPAGQSEGQATSSGCEVASNTFVNVAGDYTVKGGKADQTGENYAGDATITSISQNCFSIEWRLDGRTRTGTLQMLGNIISGTWQEGDQSGVFSGTASAGHLAIGWGAGTTEEHNTDYAEILTKK